VAFFVWDPKYSVGVAEIDNQHRRLVELIDEMHIAMKEGHAREEAPKILGGLIDYTQKHFATEERLMDRYRYPAAAVHKDKHGRIVARVLEFKEKIDGGSGASSERGHFGPPIMLLSPRFEGTGTPRSTCS